MEEEEGEVHRNVGLGGVGCWREKRFLYVGLCVDSREIKDVCECIDESVFSYCVYSTGAHCLPDSEDESDGDETEEKFNLVLCICNLEFFILCICQVKSRFEKVQTRKDLNRRNITQG